MYYVDQELCIGCAACVGECPEGYKLNEEMKSEVINQEAPCLDEGKEICPVGAIKEK